MVSKLFARSDFACRCKCGFCAVDVELLYVLEDLATHFGTVPCITSACRCAEHNRKVGGRTRSEHTIGLAADIMLSGIRPDDVADYLCYRYPDCYGIGRYDRFTHVDVRAKKARWDERKPREGRA